MMMPEDMRLWVDRDDFVWFLIDLVEGLDTAALESLGKPGRGRPGYDPRMLAVLLIYAYLQGERSSRRIEKRCKTDAAFRIATGNRIPDHSTICRFRAAAAQDGGPLEDLFTRVLFVLAAAGLGRLDVISVDGSKIWADASKQANRTEEGLRKLARKILDEAGRADGENCACQGHGHGEAAGLDGPDNCGCCDDGMLPGLGLDGPAVPRNGWGGATRAQRITAGLAELETARLAQEQERRAAAQAYLDAARAGQPPGGRVPAEAAVEAAQLQLEQALAARKAQIAAREQAAAAGRAPRGPRPSGDGTAVRKARRRLAAATTARDQAAAQAASDAGKKQPRPVRNITDPDSRLMHCTLRGPVQAYNAQVPRTRDGVILIPRLVQDANDLRQVQTALDGIAASQQVIAAGHAAAGRPGFWSKIGTILFDPGYFSQDNITLPGPDRLIGTGAWKDPGPHHPGCAHDDPRDQMHHNLSTRQGRDLYRNRAPVSEGGFADLKERTGLRRFTMRGIAKAQGELLLATTAANIHLLYRRTQLA